RGPVLDKRPLHRVNGGMGHLRADRIADQGGHQAGHGRVSKSGYNRFMEGISQNTMKKKATKRPAIFLAGPTAGGKSALALKIAEAAQGTVINADSMQVYRELRVLTARPSPNEEARVPHLLYGYRSGAEVCSAAAWAADARAALDKAWAEGRLPVVVGGTGLYFRTLLYGIAPVPDVPADVRLGVRA